MVWSTAPRTILVINPCCLAISEFSSKCIIVVRKEIGKVGYTLENTSPSLGGWTLLRDWTWWFGVPRAAASKPATVTLPQTSPSIRVVTVANRLSGTGDLLWTNGRPAQIISFLKDTEVVLIRFGDDFEIRTSKISIYKPKLLGSDFCVGDELYYTGHRERLHGKRATIQGLLPSEPDPDNRVLVQFRSGDIVKTRPGRLQRTKPETPRHSQGQTFFVPPQRVAFEMPSSASTSRIPLEDIYYSQDSIKQSFQDGQTLEKMKRQLLQGVKTVTDIPRITVVRHQGHWFSVDNRRLWVFKQVYSGTKTIPVCQGVQDHRFWNKFTTKNGGRQIRLRWSVIKYPLSPLRAYNTEAEGLFKKNGHRSVSAGHGGIFMLQNCIVMTGGVHVGATSLGPTNPSTKATRRGCLGHQPKFSDRSGCRCESPLVQQAMIHHVHRYQPCSLLAAVWWLFKLYVTLHIHISNSV